MLKLSVCEKLVGTERSGIRDWRIMANRDKHAHLWMFSPLKQTKWWI